MADIALRQIRAVIAVCEEGSFTRAAEREHATQSGISQHVAALERTLGVKLFERSARGIVPTPAGLRYYKSCVEAIGRLESATEKARGLAGQVTGDLRVGLMPTFTRAVLAPTLEDFVPRHPEVRLHVVEGYSGVLTDMVLADALDFAVVPAFEGRVGLKARLLVRDREMLLSGARRGLTPLAPLRLADCAPLKLVVPGPDNIRRRNLETYLHTHGVEVAAMLEMDAMIGTLEFVARSDWVTVLPSLIAIDDVSDRDLGRGDLVVSPIEPPLHAEFVVIQPARRTLSTQARLFLERFEAQIAHIQLRWQRALAAQTTAGKGQRREREPTRKRAPFSRLSSPRKRIGTKII
ncbi:MAG: LysR family transcriptional regulator [Hyphomicrobiales bacterium]|nr:LysR family transcriptional regulator [Hyphomicrobiales bacterium]